MSSTTESSPGRSETSVVVTRPSNAVESQSKLRTSIRWWIEVVVVGGGERAVDDRSSVGLRRGERGGRDAVSATTVMLSEAQSNLSGGS